MSPCHNDVSSLISSIFSNTQIPERALSARERHGDTFLGTWAWRSRRTGLLRFKNKGFLRKEDLFLNRIMFISPLRISWCSFLLLMPSEFLRVDNNHFTTFGIALLGSYLVIKQTGAKPVATPIVLIIGGSIYYAPYTIINIQFGPGRQVLY